MVPIFFTFLVSVGAPEEREATSELWIRDRLTGDWGGLRSRLEERGLWFEFEHTLDVVSNVSGGRRRGIEVLGNADLMMSAELEPLLGWRGGEVFLYGLGNYGGDPSANVGDLQILDHIEAFDTWKLYEAWFDQAFFVDKLSLRAGLYDLNSEFDVVPAAELFVNSSPGIGADLGLSGKNGPSIFPTTSVGARVNLRPVESLYLRAAVLDGVPGDLGEPRGTQIVFDGDDGLLLASEIGFLYRPEPGSGSGDPGEEEESLSEEPDEEPTGYSGKYALGIWGYTSDFDDFFRVDENGVPLQRRGSYGVYLLGEQSVYHEQEDPSQGLRLLARFGVADDRVNVVDSYVGGGLVYRGLIPGRDRDRIGLHVAAAHFGSEFREALRQDGVSVKRWEIALELTYGVEITPWCWVQPDFQYIINPGGDASLRDAVVVGSRFVVSF